MEFEILDVRFFFYQRILLLLSRMRHYQVFLSNSTGSLMLLSNHYYIQPHSTNTDLKYHQNIKKTHQFIYSDLLHKLGPSLNFLMQTLMSVKLVLCVLCLLSLFQAHITLYPRVLSLSSHEAGLQSYMSVLTVAIWHFLEEWLWVSVIDQPLGTSPQAIDR